MVGVDKMKDYTELLTKLESPLWAGLGIAELSAKAIRALQKRDRVVGAIAEGRRKEVVKLREQVKEYDKAVYGYIEPEIIRYLQHVEAEFMQSGIMDAINRGFKAMGDA